MEFIIYMKLIQYLVRYLRAPKIYTWRPFLMQKNKGLQLDLALYHHSALAQ